MEPILLKKNLKKDLLLIAALLAFAACGWLMATHSEGKEMTIGWVGMAICLLAAVAMALIDIKSYRHPQLIISDEGVSFYTLKGYKDVRFDEVKFYTIIDNTTMSFYGKRPKNMLSPSIGAFTIFNLSMPKDKLTELLCERLDKHGACRF